MYDWVIVGGGIQGITVAAFLLKRHIVTINNLVIIDPYEEPLSRWKHCTTVISMPYLRSPSVHHLDVNPYSLETFVEKRRVDLSNAFYGRFNRPSLHVFNEHCDHLLEELLLKKAWMQGRVEQADRTKNGWRVQLHDGRNVIGKNLLLAIGMSERPFWPEWAEELKMEQGNDVYHVFELNLPNFEDLNPTITIIGGGTTASHLALKLSALFPNGVTLLKRHPFRIHDFDSEPGWLGPKNQLAFRKLSSYEVRRNKIKEARLKGSIPRDLHIKLLSQLRRGNLRIVDGEVTSTKVRNGQIFSYDCGGNFLERSGTILLATGFQQGLPGTEWLSPMIQKYKLPCAECGFPIVTSSLRWAENLYVTGALAELEMGPIARNISGARQAAARISQSFMNL